jgi:hypothetical protein
MAQKKIALQLLAIVCSLFPVLASAISVGAAPKGDAAAVASRITKYNFATCKQVTGAARRPDGAIQAACDGTKYLVFTVFNPNEGKVIEVAMNCTAAKQLLGVSC